MIVIAASNAPQTRLNFTKLVTKPVKIFSLTPSQASADSQ